MIKVPSTYYISNGVISTCEPVITDYGFQCGHVLISFSTMDSFEGNLDN